MKTLSIIDSFRQNSLIGGSAAYPQKHTEPTSIVLAKWRVAEFISDNRKC